MFLNTLLSGVIYIIKTIFYKIPSLFFILIIMANKHIGITSLRLLFVGVVIEEMFVEVKGQNIIGIIISLSPMMVMVTWYWNEEKHLWKHFLRPSTIFDTVLCVCRYRYVQISFLYKYNKKCAWQYFSLYTIRIYTPYIFTWARQISLCILLPPRCVSQCL